jgi:hypothetical protein
MHHHKTRLMAISGATLALIVAGTAAVSAHPGDGDQRGGDRGQGRVGIGAKQNINEMRGQLGGMRGQLGGMHEALDDFERRETTVQTADGVSIHRVEQGVVESASDAGLGFTLGSGEVVTVTIDDDTEVIALEEQTVERGRRSRERMVPTEIELTDIEAGTEIMVWSDSEDGDAFVAQRIVVEPDIDEAADEATDAESEAVAEIATEEAAATDA